jgi:hypothetical protein
VFTAPTPWNASVKPLGEPLESLRRLLQEARPKIDRPIEIILIGGAAALLSKAVTRVTEDVDVLASSKTISLLGKAGALKFPIQPVADSFLCLHPDYRKACSYVRELSFPPKIRVYRLSPLDLAISKLSRFQQVDIEDIAAILTKEKIERKKFIRRYATARAYYTNPKETDFNVRLLVRKIYREEFDPKKDLPKPRGKA